MTQSIFTNILKQILVGLFVVCFCVSANASYIENFPITVTQPDGTEVHCYATGDEFYNWVHDENGFTLIRDPQTGAVVYAKLENDELTSTGYRVGSVNPATIGLQTWTIISPEKRLQRRSDFLKNTPEKPVKESYQPPRGGWNNGTLNNLVIYIRFSDEEEFPPKAGRYESYFNRDEPGQSSMYGYFKAVSNEKTFIPSTFYPLSEGDVILSYQDIHPRSYYQPYHPETNPNGYQDHEVAEREHKLLKRAVEFVEYQIPADLDLDFNGDGLVDNIAFIVSGSPGAWASLLWPHRWALYAAEAYINGKQVWDFNFLIERHLDGTGPSVLAHEMAHTLGLPDLYRYAYNGEPVGKWDLMAGNTNPPQSTTAYMKWKYGGWIDNIPEITGKGTYTLHNVWSETNNAYKIVSPNSTKGEFFVIEYRDKRVYWDKDLSGSGLIIYRINPGETGNAGGPPDEVYIYRPNGKTNMANDGSLGGAYFSSQSGRTTFNNVSNPSCFLSSNTNPGGPGNPGGIAIFDISESGGETMTFKVDFSLVNTELHVTPNILSFPNILLGTTSEPQTITVSGTDLAYPIYYEKAGGNNELFTIEEIDWNPITGGILSVKFTPEEAKIFIVRLIIRSAGAMSQTITLKASGTTVGIDDISTGNIMVYPNPTKGELRVESGEWRVENVEIFDVMGKKQKAESRMQNENLTVLTTPCPLQRRGITYDLTVLPPGIYFIRITTGNGIVTKKVIKQ
jgi:M6 family metalloprotease-like protein